MADIRIDRYEFDPSGLTGTLSITDVGNVNRAFIRNINGTAKGSAGEIGNTSNLGSNDVGCGLELTSTNQITYTKGNANTVKIMFEIWVYVGQIGGDYEFIIRDRESLQILNGQNNITRTLTLPDRNRCIPILTSFKSEQASNSNYEASTLAIHINASDNVVISRNNNGAGSTTTAYFTVVDFIGSAWNVGHGVSTAHDTVGTSGYSIDLNTDSTGIGGSLFNVSDWNTAMILDASMEGDSVETGLADVLAVYEPNTNTSVRFSFGDANARNDGVSYVHVLQCDDFTIGRFSNDNISEGNNTYGTNLTVTGVNSNTPLSQLSLEWYVSTTGTGTAFARGFLTAQLINYNTIQHWVHRQGNNVKVRAAIVDLSNLVSTSTTEVRNIKYNGANINALINGVQLNKAYYNGVPVLDFETTTIPTITAIQLSYRLSSSNSSIVCGAFQFQNNEYFILGSSFNDTTAIYTDINGTNLAPSGRYSNGVIARLWDGTNLTETENC